MYICMWKMCWMGDSWVFENKMIICMWNDREETAELLQEKLTEYIQEMEAQM